MHTLFLKYLLDGTGQHVNSIVYSFGSITESLPGSIDINSPGFASYVVKLHCINLQCIGAARDKNNVDGSFPNDPVMDLNIHRAHSNITILVQPAKGMIILDHGPAFQVSCSPIIELV